jgi:hypothetical protein
MRKVICWFGFVLLLASAGCRRQVQPAAPPVAETETTPQPSITAEPGATTPPEATPPEAAPPAVPSLAIVSAYRPAGLQSQELRFEVAEFRQRPSTGVAVTVIPLGINLPPVASRVLSVQKIPDPCSEALPSWWEVQITPLTQTEYITAASPYREAEDSAHYPFKVCVLYPANPQAQALNPGTLDEAALPTGTRLEQVVLALDLDADQTPDLVLIEACCDKPQLPLKECDLTCRKTWQRVGGQWKVIDRGTPC